MMFKSVQLCHLLRNVSTVWDSASLSCEHWAIPTSCSSKSVPAAGHSAVLVKRYRDVYTAASSSMVSCLIMQVTTSVVQVFGVSAWRCS